MELDTITCMDALEYTDTLPDNSVDLIVTSPPYDNLRKYNGYTWNFEGIACNSYRVLKPGGVLVWVVNDATVNGSETLTSMRQALYFVDNVGFRMHDTMIWHKYCSMANQVNRYLPTFEYMFVLSKGKPKTTNLMLQKTLSSSQANHNPASKRKPDGKVSAFTSKRGNELRVMDNVWFIDTGYMRTTTDVDAYEHPAIFPEALAERHILTWTNPGDVVLDYFAGSGTTQKMARNNGRHYLGCDLSEAYVAIALDRLAQPYTPQLFTESTAASEPAHEQPALL